MTRQGVRDNIVRAEKLLRDCEEKLGLKKKFSETERLLSIAKNALAGQMRPYLARMMLWRISPHHSLFRIFPPLILPLRPLGAEHRFFHYFCRPETA